jgi:alcohol dehydrogenase (cytochrome c)
MAETAPKRQENASAPNFFGGESRFPPWAEAHGWLTAFDASTGKEKWKYHAGKPMIGGVVSTAGDLVFTGELDGTFEAFDAESGTILYKHNVGGPVGGGVVTYGAGGMVAAASAQNPAFANQAISTIPAKRGGQPAEVAAAAVWLCSTEASYVYGQMLVVDGGMTIGGFAFE